MAILTAAQIKTILLTGVYPETVEINAALMQNEERRKYPSIDVQNITGEEQIKDFPSKTVGQTFLVHLFYRYRSFGEQHEPDIKSIEDVIFDTLDAAAEFAVPGIKISVTQGWRRDSETFPVHRSHSILRVSSEELEATDGIGIPGDKISVTFPSPSGTFTVINLVADDRTLQKDINRLDDGEEIFTKIHFSGLVTVEVELDVSEEADLDTLISAGKDITVTLTKNGTAIPLNVNLTSRISSATRETVQTTLVTMDVKP
jgi:hypothetical protein